MYETKFTRKCKAALEDFQKEMGAYGLTVSQCTGGRYNDDACTSFHLVMETIAVPAKGKKDLIEALEKSGYWTEKYTRKEKDGRMYFVFVAHKSVDIETGPESLDKVEG